MQEYITEKSKKIMTLHIETPALLFSATSLILLAYTNRFLTIATIVRSLKKPMMKKTKSILIEIKTNLRLTLIRYMQLLEYLVCFFLFFAMLFSLISE
jgi:hypothetical protein